LNGLYAGKVYKSGALEYRLLNPPKLPLLRGGIKKYIYLRGVRGRSPQAEIWVGKAEGLKNRVGGIINYDFLNETLFLSKFLQLSIKKILCFIIFAMTEKTFNFKKKKEVGL